MSQLEWLPQEVQQEYKALTETKQRGKEKAINRLINSCVPRNSKYGGQIKPRENTISKMIRSTDSFSAGKIGIGMDKLVMIGSRFGASKELFEEARAANQVREDPKTGKWYVTDHVVEKKRTTDDTTQGASTAAVDQTAMLSFFASMEELPEASGAWMLEDGAGSGSASGSKGPDDGAADANDMKLLQESFDAVSRTTIAIKNMGKDLVQARATESSVDLAKRGMDLCKAPAAQGAGQRGAAGGEEHGARRIRGQQGARNRTREGEHQGTGGGREQGTTWGQGAAGGRAAGIAEQQRVGSKGAAP